MTLKRSPIRRKPKTTEPFMLAGVLWPEGHITEKKFQSDVEKLAHQFGWMTSHSHLPFFDTAGWPDLALLHPLKSRFMVRELKVSDMKGRPPSPSPVQWEWLRGLAAAGVNTGVWTWPQSWDQLIAELTT